MLKTTGARLAAALLGYIALIIVLLTLNPFYFGPIKHLRLSLHIDPSDVVANALLFLPIGFLYRLTGGRYRGVILIGALLSTGVEAGQLFVPMRTPSIVDILINTFGAVLGARLHTYLQSRIAVTPAVVGRLALETPLMGLVYLLVPLLWVNSLALGAAPGRWLLTVLLGGCGAIVLSTIARQRSGTAGRVALASAVWFVIGAGLGLLSRPLPMLAIGAGVVAVSAGLAAGAGGAAERRFERSTLSRVIPLFALYLLLAALWPLGRPLVAWHGQLGLTGRFDRASIQAIFPLIEYLAAFTVLGYLSAEWRGRAELPLRRDLPRVLLAAFAIAVGLELLIGFQSGPGASLLRVVAVLGGALFGGMLYHLQRDHVRFLLGRAPAPTIPLYSVADMVQPGARQPTGRSG